MRLIDGDSITFRYDGLAFIAPDDFIGIAKYFHDQIKQIPEINTIHAAGGCYCRECKYGYEVPILGLLECTVCERLIQPEGFCHRGHRREDVE